MLNSRGSSRPSRSNGAASDGTTEMSGVPVCCTKLTPDRPGPGRTALSSLNAAVVPASAEVWQAALHGSARVWLDGRARFVLDQSTRQVGAPAAWDAGITGKGVTIADLDSGWDQGHRISPGSPRRVTNLMFVRDGQIPDPASLVAKDSSLARIRATYQSQGGAPAVGVRGGYGYYKGVAPNVTVLLDMPVPAERTEFYTPGPDVEWDSTVRVPRRWLGRVPAFTSPRVLGAFVHGGVEQIAFGAIARVL